VNPRSGESPTLFHPGEIIRGTVIDQVDPLHALILIKAEEILVENRGVSLTKDRELIFQVEAIHPKVILKIIPEENPPGQEIESLLTKYLSSDLPLEKLAEKLTGLWKISTETLPPEIQDSLKQFFSLISRFSLPLSPWDPLALRKLVAQSGIFWEARLKHFIEGQTQDSFDLFPEGDLKSLLIKLKSQLNSLVEQNKNSNPTALQDLVQGLGQFVDKIELYQILNLNHADPQGKILLLFPLWVQNSLQFVELKFSFPHQGGETLEQEELSILFLLNLPDWGRMRIEVRIKEKSLYCSFTVSDPKIKEFLDRALPELSARLHPIGYGVLSQVAVEKSENISPSLIPEMERWLNSLLNLVV
jgi:hypothetical protein